MPKLVYKVLTAAEWDGARACGHFAGSPDDLRDGFIHLAAPDQLKTSIFKHFAGRGDLVLLGFDPDRLGPGLRWEPSRSGTLFPHLYTVLDVALAVCQIPVPQTSDGHHILPEGINKC